MSFISQIFNFKILILKGAILGLLLTAPQNIIGFLKNVNGSDDINSIKNSVDYNLQFRVDANPINDFLIHFDNDYSYNYSFLFEKECDNQTQKECQKTVRSTRLCAPINKACPPSYFNTSTSQFEYQKYDNIYSFSIFVNQTMVKSQNLTCRYFANNIFDCQFDLFRNQTVIDMHNKFVHKFQNMNLLFGYDFVYFASILSVWILLYVYVCGYYCKFIEINLRDDVYINILSVTNPLTTFLAFVMGTTQNRSCFVKFCEKHCRDCYICCKFSLFFLLWTLLCIVVLAGICFYEYYNLMVLYQIYSGKLSIDDQGFINEYKEAISSNTLFQSSPFTQSNQCYLNLADLTSLIIVRMLPYSTNIYGWPMFILRTSMLQYTLITTFIQVIRMSIVFLFCASCFCKKLLLTVCYFREGGDFIPQPITSIIDTKRYQQIHEGV